MNVRQIKQIDRPPAKSDEDSPPGSISDTENWLNWIGDLDNQNNSEHDTEAENESYMQLDNSSEDSETPEQRNVSATPMFPD